MVYGMKKAAVPSRFCMQAWCGFVRDQNLGGAMLDSI